MTDLRIVTSDAVCEGGLMIDLSPMKSVRVDPVRRTARAEGGLTWGEYNRETQAFGLASTGGVVSTTGIGGLSLGGGLGWLMGKHGLTCDNLLSADGAPVAVIIAAHLGDLTAGEQLMAPLRKFGTPLADTIAPTTYVELNTLFDAAVPYGGVQRYWKSSFLKDLGDDLLDVMIAR